MINRKEYRRINVAMLIKVMGWLVMIESVFILIPLIVALIYGEQDWLPFFITMLLTLTTGYLMNRLSRPQSRSLGKREGFLLTASVWIVFSLFGMIPFIFSAAHYTVVEAFTEAVSGLTTTGTTIIDDVEGLSHSLKMWRSLMQWIGGMGIILFTLAVIPTLNRSGGIQMFNAEVTGITHNKLLPRISQTAKALWAIYLSLSVMCWLLLWLGPLDLFESITHALSTIATGGVSIYNDGIEHYNSNYVKVVTTVFMFLGSINFGLVFALVYRRFRVIRTDGPLRWFIIIICLAVVVLLISEYVHGCIDNWTNAIVDTVFMVISAFSSTSYTSSGVERWGPLAMWMLMVMIFIGGCAGSTSGGSKVDRLLVLFRYLRNEVMHVIQPNSVLTVKMSHKNVPISLVNKTVAFLALYVLIIIIAAFILAAMSIPLHDAFFTAITCISNSGTCIDIGTLGGSLVPVPAFGKIVMAMVMLIGRLEIFTILVLFVSDFWHK